MARDVTPWFLSRRDTRKKPTVSTVGPSSGRPLESRPGRKNPSQRGQSRRVMMDEGGVFCRPLRGWGLQHLAGPTVETVGYSRVSLTGQGETAASPRSPEHQGAILRRPCGLARDEAVLGGYSVPSRASRAWDGGQKGGIRRGTALFREQSGNLPPDFRRCVVAIVRRILGIRATLPPRRGRSP